MKNRAIDFKTFSFPINNFVNSVSAKDKLKLHNYRYPGQHTSSKVPPKAVINMFHGYGSYVGKFAYVAKLFADQGFDVIGYDFKGFGRSEGTRGLIEDRENLYNEGFQFVLQSKKYYQDLYPQQQKIPFITIGYSLGGFAQLGISRLMQEYDEKPDAQIYLVPDFGMVQDHWSEEYKQQLKENSKDHTQTIGSPFKPLKDTSFLVEYQSDELQFKGPHFAISLSNLRELHQKEADYIKKIEHPIHLTVALQDSFLRNDDMYKFFQNVATPNHLKELREYESDHYILSDGWLYEEVVNNQIAWINKVLPHIKP